MVRSVVSGKEGRRVLPACMVFIPGRDGNGFWTRRDDNRRRRTLSGRGRMAGIRFLDAVQVLEKLAYPGSLDAAFVADLRECYLWTAIGVALE